MATGPAGRVQLFVQLHKVGFDDDADGFLTSGGWLGNLTALLIAVREKAQWDVAGLGVAAGPLLAILASDQAHYGIRRAIQVMGWGRSIEEALARSRDMGRTVVAVVASACSTATGSYDALRDVADFCEAHNLWLHVDAAHGAGALLSPRLAPLLAGIERADSVVWDAH